MRLRQILAEVRVSARDPEMQDYEDQQWGKADNDRRMADAPYYVGWHAQSWEWYGTDEGPRGGNGRYKPKGDGGRVVAINVPTYQQALELTKKLEADYQSGKFEDKSVYHKQGIDWYVNDFGGTYILPMHKMDEFDREMLVYDKPKDYGKEK